MLLSLSAIGALPRARRLLRLKADSAYSIADFVEQQASRHGDLPFVLFEQRSITYGAFNAMANRVAHWARSAGLAAGDSVGLMMTNRPEYVAVWMGLAKVGVRAALVNTNLKGTSVLRALQATGAEHLVLGGECTANVAEAGAAALSGLSVYLIPEEGEGDVRLPGAEDIRAALARQPDANPDPKHRACVRAGDPALYIYTSGTTGMPKAAKFNHQRVGLLSLLGRLLGLRRGEVVYCPLPLYHGAGGVGAVMMAMGVGGAVAIARRFSASMFWDDVRRYDAVGTMYVGELCRFLLNQPPRADDARHNMRFMVGLGLRADIWETFRNRFGVPRIVEAYGATESNVAAFNLAGKVGSVGKIRGGLLLRYDIDTDELVQDAEGRYVECRPDEVGELLGRIPGSPNTLFGQFQGYTDAAATEQRILRDVKRPGDAYQRTGDLLRRDREGYYYFVDRVGDTFRWKGENVSTQEVEEALWPCPGIVSANVYGVRVPNHEGRAGMAALELADGHDASFDARGVYETAVAKLPSYAVPVFLRLMSEADVTGTFKLRKVALRNQGFDPKATDDPIFVKDDRAGTYVRLHDAADARVR